MSIGHLSRTQLQQRIKKEKKAVGQQAQRAQAAEREADGILLDRNNWRTRATSAEAHLAAIAQIISGIMP